MDVATVTALAAAPLTVEEAANLLETLAGAGELLENELDDIAASTGAVSALTVTRLENLAAALQPAARIRSMLSAMDQPQLEAAATLWRQRRERINNEADRGTAVRRLR